MTNAYLNATNNNNPFTCVRPEVIISPEIVSMPKMSKGDKQASILVNNQRGIYAISFQKVTSDIIVIMPLCLYLHEPCQY